MLEGMSVNDRTELVHAQGNLNAMHYRDDILERHVFPQLKLEEKISSMTMQDGIQHALQQIFLQQQD